MNANSDLQIEKVRCSETENFEAPARSSARSPRKPANCRPSHSVIALSCCTPGVSCPFPSLSFPFLTFFFSSPPFSSLCLPYSLCFPLLPFSSLCFRKGRKGQRREAKGSKGKEREEKRSKIASLCFPFLACFFSLQLKWPRSRLNLASFFVLNQEQSIAVGFCFISFSLILVFAAASPLIISLRGATQKLIPGLQILAAGLSGLASSQLRHS